MKLIHMPLFMTLKEQKLLVSMLDTFLTTKTQDIYKNQTSFYRGVKKLMDIGLIHVVDIRENGSKVWSHTLDGHLMARMFKYPERAGD